MLEVKWIKIVTNIFDDEKILLVEGLPESDSIIVIWFKLLCLAGKQNNNGLFIMKNTMPYTDEMLATIFRRSLNTVRLALSTFEKYSMIEIIDGAITIPNWGKHQSLDKIQNRNDYMKSYMKEYRGKQKELTVNETNSKSNVSALDIERERDKDIYICTELLQASTQDNDSIEYLIALILNDKSEFKIQQKDVDKWQELYPAINVMQELRNMKGWLDANPKKRKTKQGIQRFVNGWLAREQDKGGNNIQTQPQKSKYKIID